MHREIRWHDYITINAYWLGLTFLSQTMTPLIVPLLVQSFVGEAVQGTYYGNLRLWTLMVAVLVQSLMGTVSDRSTLPGGRRRPFILIGSVGLIVVLAFVGFSTGLEGTEGYWVLFTLILVQMVFANTAHAATQGLIPDLVPPERHGRFSGVKAVLELPIPVILVSFTVGRIVGKGDLWGGLLLVMAVIAVVAIVTMFAPEKRQTKAPTPFNWKPFVQLGLMTALFTVVILVMGGVVRLLGNVSAGFSPTTTLIVFSIAGLAAMIIAVAAGVWSSLRIGIGEDATKYSGFTWWVISRLAFLVGSTNIASFVIYFLQGRFGYEREQAAGPAATLTMFVGVFILLAAVPSGWLSDRFGRKPILTVSGLVATLGTVIVILSPSIAMLYAGGILFGIATGFFYAVNWALGTDIVPKDQAGRFLGMSNLAGAGAGAIGAYIGGPIADLISAKIPTGGSGYIVLFSIYAVLFLISVIALRRIAEKRPGQQHIIQTAQSVPAVDK